MSKSPWGKVGDWAAEAEREEAEEREAAAKAAADAATVQPPTSFPSLRESVTTAKQKKKTKMTLQEFTMQQSSYSSSAPSRGLTPEEMLRLPTGPKERSPEEMQYGRLGGGFSNYGSRTGSTGSNTGRAREYEGRSSYGFEDDGRRGAPSQSRVSEFDQPSRADEVDNWASMKKRTVPEYNSREARPGGKYSSLGGGGGHVVASRADEVDNWASMKKPIPQTQQARTSSFGSGVSRPETDRWTRNESFGSGFSRPEPDRWTRNEQTLVSSSPGNEVSGVVKVNKPNPFGAARPREDVLAEKGLDWKKLDLDIESKKEHNSVSGGSRPTSSQSSRPASAHSSRSEAPIALPGAEGVVKQKPKVNPFGNAKPREVLLEEKGLDWKKIDFELEHRRVDRPESEEEKNLKEEIEQLKEELLQKSGEEKTSLSDLILKKELDLELLIRQLDDKVRYSQKNFERQSSGGSGFNDRPPSRPGAFEEPRAGYQDRPPSRPGAYDNYRTGFTERPPSRPGAYEDPRSGFQDRPFLRPGAHEESRSSYPQRSSFTDGAYQEPNERPRSRGTGNSWARPSDDRRYFQGGAGRGFPGSRDVERSSSRW